MRPQESLSIDLNADLGEGFPWDEALLDRVTSASISCGAHAGDEQSIRRTMSLARTRHVVLGAHPGYADREHFGRRNLSMTFDELREQLTEQITFLTSIALEIGVPIRFIKPHGALYNQAQADHGIAASLIEALQPFGLPIVGQPGSFVEACARRVGLGFVAEGFADRRYREDGRLVPRTEPGAILEEPAEIGSQLLRLISHPSIRTICIHGDNPHSLLLADIVSRTLHDAGVELRSFA